MTKKESGERDSTKAEVNYIPIISYFHTSLFYLSYYTPLPIMPDFLSHVSIALATLKSLYNSYLSSHFSYSSSAFRKIAQAGGGVQGQGELY